MARILHSEPANLDLLARHLAAGGIAAAPTETVYGLAGNALDPAAVAKIFAVKGRPRRNPLIVHVLDWEGVEAIGDVTDPDHLAGERFWPGPLTLILKKKSAIPASVTAGLDTVAVRMPSHPLFRALLRRCSFPLAAPSANPFGYISPTRPEHVETALGQSIDYILDGGPCQGGIESTIVSLLDPDEPKLLRQGAIAQESLEDKIGKSIHLFTDVSVENSARGLLSPGLMERHYSPNTLLRTFRGCLPKTDKGDAIVFLNAASCSGEHHFALSADGRLEEVARNLYDRLYRLDRKRYATLYLEVPEGDGLAAAIRDRMRRASTSP